jgi:hypothetical protein
MEITLNIWYLIGIALGSPLLALIAVAVVVAHNKISKQQLMDKLMPYLPKDVQAALSAARVSALPLAPMAASHVIAAQVGQTQERPVFKIPPGSTVHINISR